VDFPILSWNAHVAVMEVLYQHLEEISQTRLRVTLQDIKERLKATKAMIEVAFPFAVKKSTPVTKLETLMYVDASFKGRTKFHRLRGNLHPDILYPFFVTSLVVLIAMSTVEFQKANIMPIIYGNIQNTFKGSLPAFGAISGYGASSYVMKYVTEPKKAFKWFFMVLEFLQFYIYFSLLQQPGFCPGIPAKTYISHFVSVQGNRIWNRFL